MKVGVVFDVAAHVDDPVLTATEIQYYHVRVELLGDNACGEIIVGGTELVQAGDPVPMGLFKAVVNASATAGL